MTRAQPNFLRQHHGPRRTRFTVQCDGEHVALDRFVVDLDVPIGEG